MCITALAWKILDDAPVLLAFNRDEFYARPTMQLHQWQDAPIIGGRDQKSGGTWAGINPKARRFALVLNFREAGKKKIPTPKNAISRGSLVTEFLCGDLSPMQYARSIDLLAYEGFNLVVGVLGETHATSQAVIVNNRGQAPEALENGLHVFSNGDMRGQGSPPWPKCERLRMRMRQEVLPLAQENPALDYWQAAAFDALGDTKRADLDSLPDTGVPTLIEDALSSVFIDKPKVFAGQYGTRTSSLLKLSDSGYDFVSQSHEGDGVVRLNADWLSQDLS